MSGSVTASPRVRRRRPTTPPPLRQNDPLPSRTERKKAVAAERLAYAEAYWEETKRPFSCLLFLAPLLIAYELGVLWLGGAKSDLLRNGADGWMRSWLYAAGIQYSFVLPLVVLGLLLIWNCYGINRWRVQSETLFGMLSESLIFAFALVIVGQATQVLCRACDVPTAQVRCVERPAETAPLQSVLNGHSSTATELGTSPENQPVESASGESSRFDRGLARTISFVGAGVYEEVLFRLLLLPVLFTVFRLLRVQPRGSTVLAIISSSLLFALAHYVGPAGDTMTAYNFAFRSFAGLYFAGLFLTRGFGITVGTHACYDILVGVLWLT